MSLRDVPSGPVTPLRTCEIVSDTGEVRDDGPSRREIPFVPGRGGGVTRSGTRVVTLFVPPVCQVHTKTSPVSGPRRDVPRGV